MLMSTNQVKTSSENILVTLFPTTLNTQSVVYSHMAPPGGRSRKRGIPRSCCIDNWSHEFVF